MTTEIYAADIRDKILSVLKRKGGTFEGTTGELFDALKIDPGYKDTYYGALQYLKKRGDVETDSEGAGHPATSFWLVPEEVSGQEYIPEAGAGKAGRNGHRSSGPLATGVNSSNVVEAVGKLAAEIERLTEENEALVKENEELSKIFLEVQEILNR